MTCELEGWGKQPLALTVGWDVGGDCRTGARERRRAVGVWDGGVGVVGAMGGLSYRGGCRAATESRPRTGKSCLGGRN